ncbi:AAA family ATPase [Sorangium sp. So ce385]|uniref:AAA family ATPase n=1 Tax=Sorangium sp. So ce385 TaxID=3133308 RepID=UPI003F5BD2BE
MSHGIKLVRLSVQDVGALTGRIDVGPFADGVNVISGRNEAGKSTLVEALRAALFERHDARNQKIRALQTHGTRNAPEIWVELDIGGERVSVHKRFLENRFAEVRLHREDTVVHGADAEDLLVAKLEGRRPGRTGATRNDMGLWGLLWVAQDETAYTDPGDALDANVRGALSDAIGRQVGQVLGGKHGERVRIRVIEHAARYFTAKIGTTTGEYRSAEEKLKEASARVKKIEEARAAVENLAAEHQALCEQLREAEHKLPGLEREHADAVAAEHRLNQLEGLLREADSRVATARAVVTAVQQDVDVRASLAREAEQLGAEIKKIDEATGELSQTFEHAKKAAAAAREMAAQARTAALDARAALHTAADDLDRARRRDEAARAARDLRAAEAVDGDIAEATRRLEKETIDERAFEQLECLAASAAALRARLDAEGTRIVVYPAEGEALVRSVGGPARIDVPGIGVLDVEPARPGLAQALADAERRRLQLEEALLALGVADVPAARARHAMRMEAEREAEAIGTEMRRLAPKGLDALEHEVRGHQAERARLEAALDEAARADREREVSLRGLAANRLDEAALDGLRRREQDVVALRAACDAIGTRVEMLALTGLRIRTGDGEALQPLTAGQRRALILTRGTTVVLDEVAEIRLEPRGEDLAESRARLDRAERDLAATLQALEVASVEDATEAARAWVRLDAARKRAEERLVEAAPRGLETLRAEVGAVRAQSLVAEAALASARSAFARRAQIEVELSQNRVTGDGLARLMTLERELGDAELAIERLQARVRAVAGPVAAGPRCEWAVTRAVRPEMVQNLAWEIIPGELGSGLDVDGIERRFRESLERADVPDLDAAKARFRARLALVVRLAELRKQLRSLAPDGLDALRSRAAAFGNAEEAHSTTAGDEASAGVAVLQTAVDERREEVRTREASAEHAAELSDRSERELRVLEGSLGEAAAVRHEKAARVHVVIDKLAVLRENVPDTNLWQRNTTAQWELEQALASARNAAAELEAAAPQMLRGEVQRAKGAIDSHRRRIADLHDKVLRRKTLLDQAAVEGHFEELGEAQVEQLEAAEALARVEREARAARLLSTVVEDAYAESQRLFLAPVLKEASPYLSKLRPGTEIRMTRDLKLDKVVRRGAEEDFGQLSGGTREQLSVIVRLSLARVMARDKRPLPLILDDTMGWTDDARFLSMVQILRDAASELQIILLTCHPDRFSRFQAEYSADLDRLREVPSPAPEPLAGHRAP